MHFDFLHRLTRNKKARTIIEHHMVHVLIQIANHGNTRTQGCVNGFCNLSKYVIPAAAVQEYMREARACKMCNGLTLLSVVCNISFYCSMIGFCLCLWLRHGITWLSRGRASAATTSGMC